jgi:hypothetical protein
MILTQRRAIKVTLTTSTILTPDSLLTSSSSDTASPSSRVCGEVDLGNVANGPSVAAGCSLSETFGETLRRQAKRRG